jgi:putative nucleotidyltransferase with HDIG domain
MAIRQPSWREWVESGKWLVGKEQVLPVCPDLSSEAMSLAADPDVSVHRIVRLVTKEQVLATRVLRLANSASYAPVRPITSINEAIVRCGTTAVRNTLLAACAASRLEAARVYGAAGRDLIDHSIGTAYLAQLLANDAGVEPEEALVCGLLHDIGKLVLLKLSCSYNGHLVLAPTKADIERVMRERHPLIGGQLLREWRLPDGLRDAAQYHHRPELSILHGESTRAIYVANLLSHRYGFGCVPDETIDILADVHVQDLGFDERWLCEMDERAPKLFAQARALVA